MVVQRLVLGEELLAEAEVGYFEGIVMGQNVIRFDVSVYDVVFVEIFEPLNQLFEVEKDVFFGFEPTFFPKLLEKAWKIFVIAKLENKVNSIVFDLTNHVLNFDDIGILSQLQQRFDFLPCGGYDVLYLFDLGGV